MTTLIKGGTVYDGTGDAPREADVLMEGGTVARIAPRINARAGNVIEAKGMLVAPGFVDIANYADHYGVLFSDPAGTELLIRGITSIVVGQGGASLAPLSASSMIPETWWGGSSSWGAHATTIADFFSLLKGRMGVNVGTLVGFSSVREGILRGAVRDLTDTEFERLDATLEEALKEGALGVSVNLEYLRTAGAPRHEILAAARAAAHRNAVVALRLRDREDHVKDSIMEALAIADEAKANLLITDLEPYARALDAYRMLLTQITRGSAEHNVHFTTSGSGLAGLPLPLLLPPHFREPEWHTMSAHLQNSTTREELRTHFKRFRDVRFIVAALSDPSLKLFEGTPFEKWSLHEHCSFEDALLRLMEVTGFRGILAARVGEDELANAFALHDRALIASGEAAAPSLESSPQLSFLTEARTLPIPLEQRIAKMTGAPAKKLNLTRRGFLREGYHADLIVLEKGVVREAFVNGVRAVEKGAPTGRRGGNTLMRE
ncbi:MAG: hypothetical protein Q8P88_02325 [Candidatus Jorgensenbacteria bacterium]|nr:hypothetical protein [Candidatus Jorgensenbacteria bacterium]